MAKFIKETYKKENGELVKYPLGADIKNVVITKVDENGNEIIKNTLDKELEIVKQDSSSAAYPSYSIENIEEEGLEKLTKGESISSSIRKLYKVTSRFINHLKNITSGENHIPTGGKEGDILLWDSDGQAKWGPDENTTYSNFQGATANNSGKAGLVLAPAAGEQNKFLKGDGTWGSPDNAQYTPGTGISILNNQIGLATATITNTKGTDTSGTEIILPHLVFDEYGRVKNIGTKKHTLPNSTFVGGTLTETLYYGSDKKYSTSTSGISTLSKIMLKVNSGYTGIDLISGTNNYNIGIDENILQFKKDDTIAYQINSNGSNIFNTDVSVTGLKSADKADRIIIADGTTGKLKTNSAITVTKLDNLINGDITIKTPLKITDDAGITKNIIETINPTPDSPTAYGSEVLIGGDGNVFVGAGESYRNLRNALANEETKLAGETYGAAGENMFVASDSNVLIYSAVNTPANRKAIAFDNNGCLHPLIDGQELALGTTTYPWANTISKKFHVYSNEVSNGYLGIFTQGTATTKGDVRLVLGSKIATGNDNNAVGKIFLYGENTGYTIINPTNNTTSNVTVNLPSTSGTLLTHTTITTATDFDTIKTTGIYHIKASSNTNAPTANHGTLLADFDIGTPYQIFIPDNVSNCDYKRNYKNSTWSEWAQRKFSDTTYSNFVKSGSGAKAGLVPAPSTTAGATKYLREDGTWQVPPNTTYSAMTAATADAAGKAGLVPAPAAGKQSSFLRGDGTWATPTNTKNTAGSTDSSSKLFLIGATSQAANPQTYSHNTAYVGTDGCLYSNSTKVSVEGHTHKYAGSSSAGGSATKVYGTLTNPSSETSYTIPFHSDVSSDSKALLNNDGIQYVTKEGTASADGYGILRLGNGTQSGTAKNKYGILRLFGTNNKYINVKADSITSNRTITFPNMSGNCVVGSGIIEFSKSKSISLLTGHSYIITVSYSKHKDAIACTAHGSSFFVSIIYGGSSGDTISYSMSGTTLTIKNSESDTTYISYICF